MLFYMLPKWILTYDAVLIDLVLRDSLIDEYFTGKTHMFHLPQFPHHTHKPGTKKVVEV